MQTLQPQEQPQWNSILVDVLSFFIDFCKQHQLTYYGAGGTAIGAVRHHGIIPWDDDIDVYMPRPDYDRFLQIAAQTDLGDYELVTPYNKKDYPLFFSKLCYRHTTLQEQADCPCVYGLYIDIFPADAAYGSHEETVRKIHRFAKIKNKLEAISTHVSFADYMKLLLQPSEWGRFVRKTIGFFARSWYRKVLIRQLDAIRTANDYEQSEFVAIYGGGYGTKEIFPRKWLQGTVAFPFEGITIDLPVGYDEYLRQYFGDYMQLPPVEKRQSHHMKAYFNLNEREPDEEVARKVKRG